MFVRMLAGVALGAALTAQPVIGFTAQPQERMWPNTVAPRRANLVIDAQERALTDSRQRQNFRGAAPTVRVLTQPSSVSNQQISALGFKNVPPTAAGLLVTVDVVDTTGHYQNFYVYDPRTHLIRFEAERYVLPAAAVQSRKRR